MQRTCVLAIVVEDLLCACIPVGWRERLTRFELRVSAALPQPAPLVEGGRPACALNGVYRGPLLDWTGGNPRPCVGGQRGARLSARPRVDRARIRPARRVRSCSCR